jgi:hypothetical protein
MTSALDLSTSKIGPEENKTTEKTLFGTKPAAQLCDAVTKNPQLTIRSDKRKAKRSAMRCGALRNDPWEYPYSPECLARCVDALRKPGGKKYLRSLVKRTAGAPSKKRQIAFQIINEAIRTGVIAYTGKHPEITPSSVKLPV